MKLKGLIKCPFCGSTDIGIRLRMDVTIWDDTFHTLINEMYPENNRLNCDLITYKCKCNEESCSKYFVASVKLKCEIDDIKTGEDTTDLSQLYFKKPR